ncbi:MAG: Asp-tRNA(Asn)/Glu-tRNA(Gln) amidotransferase subunit GatB [Candidatus Woesebacteria bacterium]|jgi:aspartyl-tRNA(Asn)/glutamyl-tRNA(Gln) amidotransferase subunit B
MNSNKYIPVIGLEIHAELKTKSKMFCGCKNDPFRAPKPNIYTCPVCLGMPGALPVANKKAIEWTVKLGLALNCKINLFSKFDRKNYFYPDLPKGYQISQYDIPFCYDGEINTSEGKVGITRIHLEEDTGKLLHKTIDGKKVSLIDFNRSSVPLIEIVTEPDIKSASQAKEYAKKLRDIIRYLKIGDCDMEQGGMRLEANVSLKSESEQALPNYKVEVKNINSFRFLEQAINSEIKRQSQILDSGKTPAQETRGWDAKISKTFSQRSKEEAEDYRYFPDPDLPPIRFTKKQIKSIKNSLPELPTAKSARWEQKYQIELRFALPLANKRKRAEVLDKVWPKIKKEKINSNELAKAIINKRFKLNLNDDAKTIVSKFKQTIQLDKVDKNELEKVVIKILKANPDAVKKYRDGKRQVIGFLIGQVMREIKKKIDAKTLKKMIEKKIKD